MASQLWYDAPIVALDLEGSGAQDRDTEAILEIAVVPLAQGKPDLDQAFTSLVYPGRRIQQRPRISPGLTNEVLATAPTLERIALKLAELISDKRVLGHKVNVDWQLLGRHLPALRPVGLLDTLALARALRYQNRSLSALVEQLQLTETMQVSGGGSQPHRAYWDTVAAAHLLSRLVSQRWPDKPPAFESLRLAAGIPLNAKLIEQPGLFD